MATEREVEAQPNAPSKRQMTLDGVAGELGDVLAAQHGLTSSKNNRDGPTRRSTTGRRTPREGLGAGTVPLLESRQGLIRYAHGGVTDAGDRRLIAMRLQPGFALAPLRLETILGRPLLIPRPDGLITHLQFRRFAGCPICNLHLRSVASRIDDIKRAGVCEVAVFHSSAEVMRPFQGDLPFDVVADPAKALYTQFGVERSARSVLHPMAWIAYAKGTAARHPSNASVGEGGHLGLPADFLVDGVGRIVACKYGRHADDQWSVDEILTAAAAALAAT